MNVNNQVVSLLFILALIMIRRLLLKNYNKTLNLHKWMKLDYYMLKNIKI